MYKFDPKKHLTLPYENYAEKKYAQIRAKKAPNTTLQNYAKTKNAHIPAKKAPNTTLQKLYQEKIEIRAKKSLNTIKIMPRKKLLKFKPKIHLKIP